MITLLARMATFLVPATLAWAQFTQRSTITGAVTDASGAPVPGVAVTLTEVDRQQVLTTTTEETGVYTFTNLAPGRYQVGALKEGFRKAVSNIVTTGASQSARVDLALAIGTVSESVEVQSVAPLVNSEQAVVGQAINRQFIENLPAKGRNFTAMAALTPNVSTFPRGNGGGTWAVGGHHAIAGVDYIPGGGGDVGFYMNGANINDNYMGNVSYSPTVEAISEIKVDVTSFSASSGRDVSVMQVTTRGGTNDFHGSLFDTFQNSALNAWNSYAKRQIAPGQKKRLLQRNQFGGSLGGPVIIPKLYNGRNRAFFFVSTELTRQSQGGADQIFRVPTDRERQGDFGEWLERFPGDPNYVLYNPFSTRIDANGNSIRDRIPHNDLRTVRRPDGSPLLVPQMLQMLDIFPKPNGYVNPANSYDRRNFRTFSAQRMRTNKLDSRFDYRFTDSDNVYVSFSRSNGVFDTTNGFIPQIDDDVQDESYILTANYSKILSPNMANEFIFTRGGGYAFWPDAKVQAYFNDPSTLRNQFFQNLGTGADFGIYQMNIGDLYNFYQIYEAFRNPTMQFSDNFSWIKGSHQLKMGFNYFRKEQRDTYYNRNLDFNRQFSRAGSVDSSLGGDGLASFVMGLPSSMVQRYDYKGENPFSHFRMPYYGAFIEDTWQVNSKLTLGLGLRYDLRIPFYSETRYGNAFVDTAAPGWELVIPGRADGVPQRHVTIDKNNFAPRISIAYRAKPDFVIRTSYGVFYNAGISDYGFVGLDDAFATVPGYTGETFDNNRYGLHEDIPRLTFNDIFPQPTSIDLGTYPISTGAGRGYFDNPVSVYVNDKDSGVVPYFHRYLGEVQKSIGPNTAVSVTYMGSRGVKLPYFENINKGPYQTGWANNTIYNDSRVNPNGRFLDVRVRRAGLNSYFNSGTVKLERRMSAGLQFVTHYTWSKMVDYRTRIRPLNIGVSTAQWDWNRELGRGESESSHPHRFVMALTYTTPWGRNWPWLAKTALSGWNLNTITTFESGNSLTVFNNQTSARDREPNLPNVSENPNLSRGDRTSYRWFRTEAFSAPPQDVKGNAGIGIVRGPGMKNWDISMSKFFPIREGMRIEFRGEMFNALNSTQWSGINTSYTEAAGNTFGQVTGAREPRIVQLNLRFVF